MSTALRSRTLKATSTWDRDTAPETKSNIRIFKEKSCPHELYSVSIAVSSRVIVKESWG